MNLLFVFMIYEQQEQLKFIFYIEVDTLQILFQ